MKLLDYGTETNGTWFRAWVYDLDAYAWTKLTASELAQEYENVFRQIPFFYTDGDTEDLLNDFFAHLFISTGNNRIRLLAGFIPSTSFATGHESFGDNVDVAANIDMNSDSLREDGWPRLSAEYEWEQGWWHSDIVNVAFPYTHRVFERIIQEANCGYPRFSDH